MTQPAEYAGLKVIMKRSTIFWQDATASPRESVSPDIRQYVNTYNTSSVPHMVFQLGRTGPHTYLKKSYLANPWTYCMTKY